MTNSFNYFNLRFTSHFSKVDFSKCGNTAMEKKCSRGTNQSCSQLKLISVLRTTVAEFISHLFPRKYWVICIRTADCKISSPHHNPWLPPAICSQHDRIWIPVIQCFFFLPKCQLRVISSTEQMASDLDASSPNTVNEEKIGATILQDELGIRWP